ncbi:MAG: Na/Pi symporter [Candidatus Hydrogenedentota bacterium]|nr:MAG: Na/Pi symporter [Candidatus Hydrogenedentota bacterium]
MKGGVTTKAALKVLAALGLIYCFLLSISLMGDAFRLFGEGFAERLFAFAGNRFVGLFIGILTTALVQSSSFTTSVVVGLVGGGILDVKLAVPIMMGANIGTSVTNTLVAHGHITRKEEFRRAAEGALIHDILNVLVVIVLFPLEMMFGFLEKAARVATELFGGIGGATFTSPIKAAVKPASHFVVESVTTLIHAPTPIQATVVLLFALLILFMSLYLIVKVLKSLVLARVEAFFNTYIFRNAALSLLVGLVVTSLVQSSSVTTSLIVPMAAAGVLTLEQIFPYTLGANVGTTVTAILASLATVSAGNMGGVTIAFTHLLFNVFGIFIFYPIRFIPLGLARELGRRTAENRFFPLLYVITVFFYIPGICIYLSKFGLTFIGVLLLIGLPAMIALFRIVSRVGRRRSGAR